MASINGKTVLKEFKVAKEAGGKDCAVYRDLPCRTESGHVTIDFESRGQINGIEIFITQK